MAEDGGPSRNSQLRFRWQRLVQFRLSTFLVFVTFCAVAISYREHIRRQYQARQVIVDYLIESGASVQFTPKRPRLMALFIGQELYRDVVSIDLQHQRIKDKDLRLLRGLDACERLYLANTSITNDGLAHIAHLRNLKRISLWKTRITNDGLKHLANMHDLEAIDLDHTKVDNKGLLLLRDKTNLRELSLSDWMSDRGLQHLSELKKLRKLNLNRAAVSIHGLNFLSSCQLETIEADSYYVLNNHLLELLAHHKHLERLQQVRATSDNDVELICKRLRPYSLELEGSQISDKSIPHVAKLNGSSLAVLTLRGTAISRKGFQKLKALLKKVAVTRYPRSLPKDHLDKSTNTSGRVSMSVDGSALPEAEKQLPVETMDVSSFFIRSAKLNDESMSLFQNARQLEFIFLMNSEFTAEDLSPIRTLKRLRLLDVTLTAGAIDAFAKTPALQAITIERCKMPDDAIACLSRSRTLRELRLVGRSGFRAPLVDQHMHDLRLMTQIESLDLSYTDFNDDGCIALKNLTNLRKLDLTGTFITGNSRPILESLPNLEEIRTSSRMASVVPANAKDN